jgi:hypothetical protein
MSIYLYYLFKGLLSLRNGILFFFLSSKHVYFWYLSKVSKNILIYYIHEISFGSMDMLANSIIIVSKYLLWKPRYYFDYIFLPFRHITVFIKNSKNGFKRHNVPLTKKIILYKSILYYNTDQFNDVLYSYVKLIKHVGNTSNRMTWLQIHL